MMRFSTTALAACLLTFSTIAAEIPLDSRIESVSLFRDGALVTRTGSAQAPAGTSVIMLSNLPTELDQSTLLASFANAPDGIIRNAQLSIPDDVEDPEIVKTLQASEKDKQKQIRLLEQKIANAQAEANFAQQIGSSFSTRYGQIEEGSQLTIEQAKATWDYIDETKTASQSRIVEIQDSIEALREELSEIQKELQEAVILSSKLRSVAAIEVELAADQEIELMVSYLVTRANWQPRYEIRALPDTGTVNFGYFAKIAQNSGENWSGVALSLHTNQANRGGNVPTLHPLQVDRIEDYARMAAPPAMFEMTADDGEYRAKGSAAVTSSTISFQAVIPGLASVPSGENPTVLPVVDGVFTTRFWSETVPRLQLDAYLRGKTTNSLDLPILPGEGLAFVDGKLSSKVALDKTLPGEEFELSFGVDPMIVVKRIEGAQEDADSGFIDKTVTLRRQYKNQITSYHSVDHKVAVVDQFPISQNAKIEIRRLAPKDSDVIIEEADKDSGIYRWETTLKPKQTQSFLSEYEIIYPRDWVIQPGL